MMAKQHVIIVLIIHLFYIGIGTTNAALSFANYYGNHMVLQKAPKQSIVCKLFSLVFFPFPALSFANYYGNHMVLQKAHKQAIVWGYCDQTDESIQVQLSGHPPIKTKSRYDGSMGRVMWKAMLPPENGQQPFTITVSSKKEQIQIIDVLFGDVWICSGQSNMQFTLSMVDNASAEIAEAEMYSNVRLFTVGMNTSTTEEYDVTVEQPWSLPNKDSVGHSNWSYFSAVCWLYGKYLYQTLKYPIGLISTTWGGTPVEAWSSTEAMANCQPHKLEVELDSSIIRGPQTPSVLWNAMVHPLLNLTIFGAIWYQGEANSRSPDSYKCRFPAMINDWRTKFHSGSEGQTEQTFPFGFVQLAGNRNNPNITYGFPEIRWHQTADFGYVPNPTMPATFMAVAMDLPDFTSPFGSIHPRDKQDVAARLVRSGLSVAYNMPVGKFQGPQITAYYADIGFYTITIELDKGASPIEVRSKDGFELCCSLNNQSSCDGTDSKWVHFPIVKHTDTAVTFNYTDGCAGQWIMGIRYAWMESPCPFKQCAIYSVENEVPMAPFVTIGLINTKFPLV